MTTWGEVIAAATYAVAAAGGIALAVIDARTKILPDRIIFPLYGIGLAGLGAASWLEHRGGAFLTALTAMAVLFGLLYLIAMFGSMGYGDVKLAGLLGLYLGWLGLPVVVVGLVLGTLIGALVCVGIVAVHVARRQPWRKLPIAFGPFLIAGAVAAAVLRVV